MKRILIILLFSCSFFEINAFAKPTYVRALEVQWSRNTTGVTFNKDGSKMYLLSSRQNLVDFIAAVKIVLLNIV